MHFILVGHYPYTLLHHRFSGRDEHPFCLSIEPMLRRRVVLLFSNSPALESPGLLKRYGLTQHREGIYVCEALFESGIRPTRKTGTLKKTETARLCDAIKGVLARAIDAGGSSLRDYKQVSGELGYFQHAWSVYGRENEACKTCKSPIERIVQSNRSTFFCAACQR